MFLFLLKSVVLLGLLIFSLYGNARPLIITIDASSNDGGQMGRVIGDSLQKNLPDVTQQYDRYLEFLLSSSQFKQLTLQVSKIKPNIDKNYQTEVNAIATALQLNAVDKLGDGQLSLNEFWLLQFLADLTAINKGSAIGVSHGNDKTPIAARNVDWKNAEDLSGLQTINLYHYKDRTVVTVGFAGMVGVINGFNDQGLFASLLDTSGEQMSTGTLPKSASSFELRSVLRQTNNINSAVEALAQKTYSRHQQILLADQNRVAVLEQPAGKVGILRQTDSAIINEMPWNLSEQLAMVSCFVLKESPRNCYTSTDYYRWGRFAQLLQPLSEQVLSVDNVMALMQDQANTRQAIFNNNTVQAIIFTPKDRALYFYGPSDGQTDQSHPVFEKYQFISPHSSFKKNFLDIAFLGLSISVFVVPGFYIFRRNNKKSSLVP